MSGDRLPHLQAVPNSQAVAPSPAPPERGLQGLRLLLVLALVGIVVYGAWQAHRAAELEARVVSLSAALESAQADVSARRLHLDDVRGAISSVRESLEALETVSALEPAPATASETPAAE